MGKAGGITTYLSHKPKFYIPHQESLYTKAVIKEQPPKRNLSAVLGIRIRIRIRTKKSRLPNTEEGSTHGTQVANQRATVLVWCNINLPMYFHLNEKSRVQ
jgi:hypothetical protein